MTNTLAPNKEKKLSKRIIIELIIFAFISIQCISAAIYCLSTERPKTGIDYEYLSTYILIIFSLGLDTIALTFMGTDIHTLKKYNQTKSSKYFKFFWIAIAIVVLIIVLGAEMVFNASQLHS